MPPSDACVVRRDCFFCGNRKVENTESGKGIFDGGGWRDRAGKLIPRVSASMTSSRAVMTQSTSRTGCDESSSEDGELQ